MGYTRIKQQDHNNTYYTEFVCDLIEDIEKLPTGLPECGQGSAAICIENSEVYLLNSEGKWVML